jgi:hypothetical protein
MDRRLSDFPPCEEAERRATVLSIAVLDNGSSAEFRMRDDSVSSISS